ncbi:MAG TPA: phage tail protein [Gaiellaceae bacterium]|nr:phage tail protein [Gaiellaceae bacterium]
MAVQRDNPYANYNFVVDLGQGDEAGFSEAELPSGEIEVIEYREGDEKVSSPRKLPGRVSYPNVVLKRGLAGGLELFDWWKAVRDGSPDRRTVAITLLDEQRAPVQRWRLRNAWPAKLEYSSLNALGNEVVIETLELAHEGFETE